MTIGLTDIMLMIVFCRSSNTAGHDINSFVLDHWRKGEQRESIKLSDMEALLSRTAVNVKGTLYMVMKFLCVYKSHDRIRF